MTESSAGAANDHAVLLMGYGSPDGSADLPEYLREVLHGRQPSAEMVDEYRRRYDLIGGSPQNRILASLRSKLERRLRHHDASVDVLLGVKHGRPALRDVVADASARGYRRLTAVATTPYPSLWIGEPYREGVAEGQRAAPRPIDVDVRLDWHLDANWIRYWSRAITRELGHVQDPGRSVLLSAHSLPQRMLERGDPYPELLHETSRAIAEAAKLDRWSFTFQSAGNTTEAWLGPDITDVMVDWQGRGARTQLVASFGFVFDHLEVLYDLDVVVREYAGSHGIDYRRVPMPNDADEVVEALAARVESTPP
jgi:protoporphyrin/coproporphyrin ferrochelatase